MLETIKKAGAIFWVDAVACVLSLVATILFIVSNATAGYAVDGGVLAILGAVVAVLLIAANAYSVGKFGAQHPISAVTKLVSVVLCAVAFAVLLCGRAVLASGLFTWDHANTVGWAVFIESVVAIVMFLVADIVLIVSAFMKGKKA